MKTKPFAAHQAIGARLLSENPQHYMLGCEQGTGKTWMLLADAERQYEAGEIAALLVIAPRGVHHNWVRREIPTHLSAPHIAIAYSSGAGKRAMKQLEALVTPSDATELRILTINVDALSSAVGFRLAHALVTRFKAMIVWDESHDGKNPAATRTKRAIALARHAVSRRAASGTPIGQGPADAYSQFDFLAPGLLGTTSYRAFVAEYSQLLPPTNQLALSIVERRTPGLVAEYRDAVRWGERERIADLTARLSRVAPQIVARDVNGRPRWRNLEKLTAKLDRYMYRVLKRDCLDLPPKVYQTHYFELPAAQRRLYDYVDDASRFDRQDGIVDIYSALTKAGKLRQVTSGFIMVDGEATELMPDAVNPRLGALIDCVADLDGQFIVWATFREEIVAIERAMRALGITCTTYCGDTSDAERADAIDAFQAGSIRAFIGNPASGGTGITLTAAQTAIYYSNNFSLQTRLQSEDRNHRIGTTGTALYIDLAAADTYDETVAAALQSKREVAEAILGDEIISKGLRFAKK